MRPIIGYNPVGGGGISNQKMALLGLFITALETGSAIALPDICILDQVNHVFDAVPLDRVFDETAIRSVAERFSIEVVDQRPSDLPHGYDSFFWKTVHVFENMPFPTADSLFSPLVIDFLGNLHAEVRRSHLFKHVKESVLQHRGVSMAAQFRIEKDWQEHTEQTLKINHREPEDFLLSYEEIVGKIVQFFPSLRSIYAICDEPACPVPKEIMRRVLQDRFGISLVWKSDFLGDFDQKLLTPLNLSLLDFEMGLLASKFVGLSRSTFSNMITLQKRCIKKIDIDEHFIYNKAGPVIVRRTDNGCCFDPTRATLEAAFSA